VTKSLIFSPKSSHISREILVKNWPKIAI